MQNLSASKANVILSHQGSQFCLACRWIVHSLYTKMLYLSSCEVIKKWTMKLPNWEQDIGTVINSLRRKGQQVFVMMAEWKFTQNT